MENKSIRTAVKNIETALLHSNYPVNPAIDMIVSSELKKIQGLTSDSFILALLHSIRRSWNIYTGHKVSKGLRPGTDLLKHWILDDCEEIKTHTQKRL